MSAHAIRGTEALPSIAQPLAGPDEIAGMSATAVSGTDVPISDIGITLTGGIKSNIPSPRLAGKTGESGVPISTAVRRPKPEHLLEQKFRRLVEQWHQETEHISSITKASMHPAYQRIIGMGHNAIPLLLRELQQNPDHWFWALNAISEQDPARSEDTFDGAVRAWLKWGKENDYL
jgi:hypothetical protein